MGRPKDSKNKKNQGTSGDGISPSFYPGNGGPLSDDEQRLFLLQGCVRIEQLTAQIDSLTGRRRAERAKLKVQGFPKYKVDHALDRRKAIRDGTLDEELNNEIEKARIDRWFNIKPGHEPKLFDNPATNDSAFEDGKIAAAEGVGKCIPPEHLNQEAAQRWIAGWHEMTAIMIKKGIQPTEPPADGPDDTIVDLRPRFAQQRETDNAAGAAAVDSLVPASTANTTADTQ